MKKDNNFKKALNELLNLDKSDSNQVLKDQGEAESTSGQTDEENPPTGKSGEDPFSESSDTDKDAAKEPGKEESGKEESVRQEPNFVSVPPVPYGGEPDVPKPYSRVEKPVYEAVITPDVVIKGDIIAGSNLKILGKVFGNVDCQGAVMLSGSVEGDVSAEKLRFMAGGIQGNVSVRENIMTEKGTRIKGDVSAGSAVLSGNVQGELNVHENLELRETSSVIGNIKALGIAIFNGSRIKGMMDVGGDLKEMRAENEE